MIRPEPVTIDGRKGVIVFLDAEEQPVKPDSPDAVIARAVFDDGGYAVYTVPSSEPEPKALSYREKLRVLQLDWDEAQHPRDETGKFAEGGGGGASPYAVGEGAPRGGEGQQALFEYAPEAGSEAALRVEARAGIAEVEKLLEAAIDDADYKAQAAEWDDLDSDDVAAIENHFVENHTSDDGAYEAGTEAVDEYVGDHLTSEKVWEQITVENDFAGEVLTKADIDLDPDSIEKAGSYVPGSVKLDPTVLRTSEGAELTKEQQTTVGDLFYDMRDTSRDQVEDELRNSDAANEREWEAKRAWAESEWGGMDSSEQFNYGTENGLISSRTLRPGAPETWKWDSEREEDEDETDEDYLRTRAISLELVKDRTDAIMKERGVSHDNFDADGMGAALWGAWKGSSTSPLGYAMQMMVAEELGTLPTSSVTQENKDTATREMVNLFTSEAERRGEGIGVFPGEEGYVEHRTALETLAKDRVKAYVRGQWETTQFLLKQAETERIQMYRAIIRPTEEVEGTRHESLPVGRRLPDYKLKQNAVASATTKPGVANDWGGVGVKFKPGTTERVVLRFDAPPTAIFSLPVYGQNVHAESEVVLIGTKGLKWDAWHTRGPGFDAQRIDMAMRRRLGIAYDVTEERPVPPEPEPKPEPTPEKKSEAPEIDMLKDQPEHWLAPEHYKTKKPPASAPKKAKAKNLAADQSERITPREPDFAIVEDDGMLSDEGLWRDVLGDDFPERRTDLGDVEGHPFRGNQYTEGTGGATFSKPEKGTRGTVGAMKTWDADTKAVVDKATMETFAADVASHMPGEWQVTMEAEQKFGDGVRVQWRVGEAFGKDAGIIERQFYRDPSTGDLLVEHESMRLPASMQNKGIGKDVLREQIAFYDKLGVTKVRLHANIDVGGYAWARAGWKPETPGQLNDFKAAVMESVATKGQGASLRKLFEEYGDDPRVAWAVADRSDGFQLLGKADWGGTLDMKDPATRERVNWYLQPGRTERKPRD